MKPETINEVLFERLLERARKAHAELAGLLAAFGGIPSAGDRRYQKVQRSLAELVSRVRKLITLHRKVEAARAAWRRTVVTKGE